MEGKLFEVPISFHVFNRPETTKIVFDEIRKIRPRKLFITADGARKDNPDDEVKCLKTRAIVSNVDWDCEVYTNFSNTNKGSYKSTSEGISWVFSHVERAVILEDDCVPHESFFRFCNELLDYYEDDLRVALISGNNFQPPKNGVEGSYYFTRYSHIWGWATWKRTWEQVDLSMTNWPDFKKTNNLKSTFSKTKEINWWGAMYQEMYDKKRKPHWDFLLSLSLYMNNTLAITPNVNLVSNVGFGPDSSNCKTQGKFQCLESREMVFPLKHPNFIARFVDADDFTEKNMFSGIDASWKVFLVNYLPAFVTYTLKKVRRSLLRR